MQIDLGEKWISIAGVRTKIHLFVAVLGYSRRMFVRASLSQRQDGRRIREWIKLMPRQLHEHTELPVRIRWWIRTAEL